MVFILQVLANSIAILLSARFIKGVEFAGQLSSLVLTGTAIAASNIVLKPALKILSLPIILLTFGIFSFFISMAILWIADLILADLAINSFTALFLTTAIIGFFNVLICPKKNRI